MRSIKPGRGPSAMGAAGGVAVGIFGIIWTMGAASMGAPPFFVLFGVVFVILAIAQTVYHFKNATGKNRMSEFDITEDGEEPDPLDRAFGRRDRTYDAPPESGFEPGQSAEINFCPYCGNKVMDEAHLYCSNCGKEVKQA